MLSRLSVMRNCRILSQVSQHRTVHSALGKFANSVAPLKREILQLSDAFDLQHDCLPRLDIVKRRPELLDRFDWLLVQAAQDVPCLEGGGVRIQFGGLRHYDDAGIRADIRYGIANFVIEVVNEYA